MATLEEVYSRLVLKKKQKRDLAAAYQDELKNHARYQELLAQIKALRDEKKSIECELLEQAGTGQDIDLLKIDIKSDLELLADIALNLYVSNQNVEIIDEWNNRWSPLFSVRFVKGGYAEEAEKNNGDN
jgi:hypothetical protein